MRYNIQKGMCVIASCGCKGKVVGIAKDYSLANVKLADNAKCKIHGIITLIAWPVPISALMPDYFNFDEDLKKLLT